MGIKFRAWIKKEYDQCGGFMLYDPDKESTDYFMVSNGTGFAVVFDDDWLKEDTYEIMQSTGIEDKNGVEIYEGDVVEYFSLHSDRHMLDPSQKTTGHKNSGHASNGCYVFTV